MIALDQAQRAKGNNKLKEPLIKCLRREAICFCLEVGAAHRYTAGHTIS